jgi:hypothetical protein
MKSSHLALLVLLMPLPALACISLQPDPANTDGAHVLVGYVTGEAYPDYEATLVREGVAQYPRLGRHIVRVTPVEALAGPLLGPMEVETSCYAEKPSPGDRAIVIRKAGHTYVAPATPKYESAIRAALAGHGR